MLLTTPTRLHPSQLAGVQLLALLFPHIPHKVSDAVVCIFQKTALSLLQAFTNELFYYTVVKQPKLSLDIFHRCCWKPSTQETPVSSWHPTFHGKAAHQSPHRDLPLSCCGCRASRPSTAPALSSCQAMFPQCQSSLHRGSAVTLRASSFP